MDTNGRGTVFHPLNGSGAKGTTGRSNASRRKQKERILPKGYPSRIGALCGCTVARNHLHWSTFSFSESRTAVFFSLKRKSGFGPRRAGKKVIFPARATPPSVRRHSTHRARAVSKRHSRQETACRQRLGCGPGWASRNQQTKQTKSLPKRKNGFTHKGYAPSGQTKINKTKKKKASTEDGRNFLKPPSPTGETEPPNISHLHSPI